MTVRRLRSATPRPETQGAHEWREAALSHQRVAARAFDLGQTSNAATLLDAANDAWAACVSCTLQWLLRKEAA